MHPYGLKKTLMKPTNLSDDLKSARESLERAHGNNFARILLNKFNMPIEEYVDSLWSWRASRELDPLFKNAFREELVYLGIDKETASKIIENFEKFRTMHTGPHTSISNGPAFLGMNWLATLSSPKDQPTIIGTHSNIPFSSESRPGALHYSSRFSIDSILKKDCSWYAVTRRAEKSMNLDDIERYLPLFNAKSGNYTVYGSSITTKCKDILQNLTDDMAKILSEPLSVGSDFRFHALKVCSKINSLALKKQIIHVDLPSIVARYVRQCLLDSEHSLSRLLQKLQSDSRLSAMFPLFCRTWASGKNFEMLMIDENSLRLRSNGQIMCRSKDMLSLLASNEICPSTFLVHTVLAFINGINCVGGFHQLERMRSIRDVLLATGIFDEHELCTVPIESVLVGRMVGEDGQDVCGIDCVLGTEAVLDSSVSVGEFAASVIRRGKWRH